MRAKATLKKKCNLFSPHATITSGKHISPPSCSLLFFLLLCSHFLHFRKCISISKKEKENEESSKFQTEFYCSIQNVYIEPLVNQIKNNSNKLFCSLSLVQDIHSSYRKMQQTFPTCAGFKLLHGCCIVTSSHKMTPKL